MKKFLCAALAGLGLLVTGSVHAFSATLEPVVVTATRTSQPVSEVAASVSVITADEITASGATRLEEVLGNAVGLHVVGYGPAGSVATPSIRGSEGAQVLVLLDGVRLNSPQNGQFNLSNLPVSLQEIDRIEVLRGPASALYGSNALGGVIQIFTRAPDAEPHTRLSWNEGRFDSRRFGFSTSRAIEGIRYRVGAAKNRSDGYRKNSDLDQNSLEGLLGFDLPGEFDLEISAFHLDKENGTPGSTAYPSPEARQRENNTSTSLKLAGPAGPLVLTARGIYERSRNEYADPGAFIPEDDRHIVETLGAELQGETKIGSHAFLLGGDFYRDHLDSTASGDHDQNRWSAFGQYDIEATSRAKLILGLRYDAHSDFDNETSPRIAALFSLTETTRLRASIGKAYRAPTLNDRFWPDTGWTKGNPDLDPETAWEYELGLDQGFGEWGNFTAAVFRRDAKDLIDWQADSNYVWSPVNVNKARIWGAEAETKLRLHRFLDVGANYTYLHPKNVTTGEYLSGKPRHQVGGYLEIGPVRDARLRFAGRYVRYYPDTDRVHQSHTVFDVTLSRPFIFANSVEMEMSLSVKNLFDRDYEDKPGYPMPPRELELGVSVYF